MFHAIIFVTKTRINLLLLLLLYSQQPWIERTVQIDLVLGKV